MTAEQIVAAVIVTVAVLAGIRLLSSPRTAVVGNRLGALAMLAAIVAVLAEQERSCWPLMIGGLVAGGLIGGVLAARVTMLGIPQLVALFNGLGGLASLVVAALIVADASGDSLASATLIAAGLAMTVGAVTFGGSMIAAGKLAGIVRQRPVTLPGHSRLCAALLVLMVVLVAAATGLALPYALPVLLVATTAALAFGILFSVRIGGADMPVTIALLNALSGLAASICGFAVEDALLIAIGAIVGSAGLILTRIMCRAMNRSLSAILTGATVGAAKPAAPTASPSEPAAPTQPPSEPAPEIPASPEEKLACAVRLIADAARVVVIPGYGMALAQAQAEVKRLFDWLVARDKDVQFAIHPVAGRMPGHMNVLLAEVDIPYERLQEMDVVNPLFPDADIALIVGACDVVNPAANSAEGTPIYGMPILNAHEAKHAIVCNLDERPGYSGVDNPLYKNDNALLLWGNAAETVAAIVNKLADEQTKTS